MQDIGMTLDRIMRDENCSPIRAFFILTNEEGEKDGIRELQSKSCTKVGRRLRDKGNFKNAK